MYILGTGEVTEPEIVSFDDMMVIGGDDPTDPAPAPAPTSKEDRMTEELPADNMDNEIVDNTTDSNTIPTTPPPPATTMEDEESVRCDPLYFVRRKAIISTSAKHVEIKY